MNNLLPPSQLKQGLHVALLLLVLLLCLLFRENKEAEYNRSSYLDSPIAQLVRAPH